MSIHTISTLTSNVYVVRTDTQIVLIDSGEALFRKRIVRCLHNLGVRPDHIDYVVLTHGHADHAGNAAFFQQHGARIVVGGEDASLLAYGCNDELYPVGVQGHLIRPRFQHLKYEPLTPDIAITEDVSLHSIGIDINGSISRASHHTAGSLIVRVPGAAFVGDMLRGGAVRRKKPTRHYFMEDLEQNSKEILALAADESITTWYPGHFGPLSRENIVRRFE